MSEFFLELFSEEIPATLQKTARDNLQKNFVGFLKKEEIEFLKSFKRSYINPVIIEESGEEWPFNEGCLSIPGINEDVFRFETIKIQYQDIDFDYRVMVYKSGFIIYKRLNEWKTKNKDNFPYGTEWRERKDIVKLRK